MSAFRWITASAFMALSCAATADVRNNVIVTHHETLEGLELPSGSSAAASRPEGLSFEALGRRFDLELEPNLSLFSDSARRQLPAGIAVYRGRIAGNDSSWVRLVIAGGQPRGMIFDGEELIAIEAPEDSAVAASSGVIYRLADVQIVPGTMTCAGEHAGDDGQAMYDSMVGEIRASLALAPGAISQIDMGTIADFEFSTSNIGDAGAAMLSRMNNVDGIFSAQVGVQVTVQTVEVFSDIDDPFTDETDAGRLLDEVAQYRFDNASQFSNGLTHLFTGRVLDTTTVGIAYTGALCSQFFGAGLTEGRYGATTDSLIAAHEIGHNFGAPHDGVPGPCVDEPQTFLMAPQINQSDQFSACSIAEMQPNIDSASCIFPLPTVNIGVMFPAQPPSALLGNSVTVTFDVPNTGSENATNVVVDAVLPSNVSFISAASSAGACTLSAGDVNCPIGTVAGSASASVTISMRAETIGTDTMSATVTADDDTDTGNNQASTQLTVLPAVDLRVTPPGAVSVLIDNGVTVTIPQENVADLDATGVSIGVQLDSGLEPTGATWSIGTCTTSGQSVDCTAGSFAAQSSATLTIFATGVEAGPQNYSVTIASAEADRNPADNSLSGTVNVTEPGSEQQDEGAGAGGPLLPGLLLLLLGGRRRRRAQ